MQINRQLTLNQDFNANNVSIDGVQLGSRPKNINYSEIIDIHINNEEYKYLNFENRLKLIEDKNGWIHCAGGISYGINKGVIRQIKLCKPFVENDKCSKQRIIEILGEPDKEMIEDISFASMYDYNIESYIMVYYNRLANLFLESKSLNLKEIWFGEINEKYYTKM